MQSNTTITKTAKIEIAKGWIAGSTKPLQRETAIRFAESLAEHNPPAASTLKKLKVLLAEVTAFTKAVYDRVTELLDLFVCQMEGHNESLAERLNIEKVICASDPEEGESLAFPSDFPTDRMTFVSALPEHMQADLIDQIANGPKRETFPLYCLIPDTASEELLEYIAGLEPSTTAEQFVGECTDPFILLLAAQETNVPAGIIEENEDAIEKMTAAEACEHIRESGLGGCIVTNLLSL